MSPDESSNISTAKKDSNAENRQLEGALRQLGRISRSCRTLGWKEARSRYTEALSTLSKDFQVSAELVAEFEKDTTAFIGGDEHINLRIASDKSRIYKITKDDSFGCCVYFDPLDDESTGNHFLARTNDDPWFYLERWRLLNSINEYSTRLEGILEPEHSAWLPCLCVSQPVLAGKPYYSRNH